jgi:hypothetical protein
MKNIAKHSEDISASVVLDLFDNNVNYFPPTLVPSECQQKKKVFQLNYLSPRLLLTSVFFILYTFFINYEFSTNSLRSPLNSNATFATQSQSSLVNTTLILKTDLTKCFFFINLVELLYILHCWCKFLKPVNS